MPSTHRSSPTIASRHGRPAAESGPSPRALTEPADLDHRRATRRAFLGACCASVLLAGCRHGREDASSVTGPSAPDRPGPSAGGPSSALDPGLEPAPAILRPPTVEPRVRVLVHRVRGGEGLRIGAEGPGLPAITVLGPDGEPAGPAPSASVLVRRTSRGLVLRTDGGRATIGPGETLALVIEPGPTGPHRAEARMVLGERAFTGRLILHPVDGGIDVVEHLAMEAYLPGVLARELYHHWAPQTFLAQAVAARSFACSEVAHYSAARPGGSPRRHYDLTDTTRSQVYQGHVEHGLWTGAVEETRGLVLVHGAGVARRLVPGYYSSCCGGTAARAVDAIGPNPVNDVLPLEGSALACPCSNAPRYRWLAPRSAWTLTERLRVWGGRANDDRLRRVGRLRRIVATHVNDHGRPVRYRLDDVDGGSVELGAEGFRAAANLASRSNRLDRPRHPLWSSFVDAAVDGGRITFQGAGHGHGVGLCQYGAQALATDGASAWTMLGRYYPGADLLRAWPGPSPGAV